MTKENESKWNKARDIDYWEQLVINVALTNLYRKWENDVSIQPSALTQLAELRLDLLCLKGVIVE